MASLSNINGLFDVHSTGAILFSTSHGTSGQILKSNGNAAPTWVAASTVIGGPYLPLTGGTLSGPLAGTSATFSGSLTVTAGAIRLTGANQYYYAATGTNSGLWVEDNFALRFGTNNTERLIISNTGNATFAGNVGIGLTADTDTALKIKANGNTYSTGNIILEDADSTTKSGITHVNEGLYLSHNASTDDLALTSGNATFAGNITFGDGHFIGDDGDDNLLIQSSANENIIIDSADDIILDAGGDDIKLNVSGTEYGKFNNDSSNLNIFSSIQDKDIVFRGNDGGSSITALTLDMSNGGSATFRDDIDFGGKLTQTGTGANTFAGQVTTSQPNSGLDYPILIGVGSVGSAVIGYQTRAQFKDIHNNAFNIDAANLGSSQWVKIGTLSNFGQSGYTFVLCFYGHTGYNAANGQDWNFKLFMKTSNGNAGGPHNALFNTWVEHTGNNTASPELKWVNTDASGTPTAGGTSFVLYMNVPQFVSGSIYTVKKHSGNWTSNNTTGQSDPGVNSTTVLKAESTFNILNTDVGIGTVSPGAKLDVRGTGNFLGTAASGAALVTIENNSGSTATSYGLLVKGGGNSSSGKTFEVRDDSGNTDLMVKGNGNVGIGTTSPEEKLHVEGTIQLGNTEHLSWAYDNGSYYNYITNGYNSTDGVTYRSGSWTSNQTIICHSFETYTGDWQKRLVIRQDGNVGIGSTSPASPLVVVGTGVGGGGTISVQGANAHVGFKNSSGTFRSWVGHFNAAGHGSDADLNLKTGYGSVGNIRFTADGDTTAAQMFLQGSTGNVGIGETSPSAKLHVKSTANADVIFKLENTNTGTSAGARIELIDDEGGSGSGAGALRHSIKSMSQTVGNWIIESGSAAGQLDFSTVDSFIMRLDESQNVLIGKTSQGLSIAGIEAASNATLRATKNNSSPVEFNRLGTDGDIVLFYKNTAIKGSISITSSAVSYNTSSDYRLKEDLQDFKGLDMVSKIPVYDFKWKTDENRSYGVMAHELQEVLPDAVSGDKDAEEMQGVDYSKIVPLLIKSIQELEAKIKKLENK